MFFVGGYNCCSWYCCCYDNDNGGGAIAFYRYGIIFAVTMVAGY